DLTDVLFIATAHDFYRVPSDLRDLLVEIRIAGYTPEEKVDIALERMLPRLIREHGLEPDDVAFDRDTLFFLARGYARDSGLGLLHRALGTLLRTRARAKAQGDTECRSEEHTSELQSRENLVCRLLLEKKKKHTGRDTHAHQLTT